jgi:hypothetical protein
MKKFKITASYTVYCSTIIEAKNEDDAYAIAKDMDGGDFEVEPDTGLSDWNIDEVYPMSE